MTMVFKVDSLNELADYFEKLAVEKRALAKLCSNSIAERCNLYGEAFGYDQVIEVLRSAHVKLPKFTTAAKHNKWLLPDGKIASDQEHQQKPRRTAGAST